MKIACAGFALIASASVTAAALYTNNPDADAFVRAAAPMANYGGAGSLSISGATATNVSGVANGVCDSFLRWNTAAMVASCNASYGSNNWVIDSVTLVVTEMGAPNNAIFDRGVGRFEARWIANDAWTEGSGMPATPGTAGIVYNNEATLLNAAADVSLGVFTNRGADGAESFALTPAPALIADLAAGGEVDFYLTAMDAGIGFTVNSRSFGTAPARPFLIVSATAQPRIASVAASGANLILQVTNVVAQGVYTVVSQTNIAAPLSAWTPVFTNTAVSAGAFSVTLTNALTGAAPGGKFFAVKTQ